MNGEEGKQAFYVCGCSCLLLNFVSSLCNVCSVSLALFSLRASGSILHFGRHVHPSALPCTCWL